MKEKKIKNARQENNFCTLYFYFVRQPCAVLGAGLTGGLIFDFYITFYTRYKPYSLFSKTYNVIRPARKNVVKPKGRVKREKN